jgi:hypothetical protein
MIRPVQSVHAVNPELNDLLGRQTVESRFLELAQVSNVDAMMA